MLSPGAARSGSTLQHGGGGVLKTCPVTTQPSKNVTSLYTHTPAHSLPVFHMCLEEGGAMN